MKTYKSPVYPALMVRLPSDRRAIKAEGGFFNVKDADVDEFEAWANTYPHYRIEYVGTAPEPEHGAVAEGQVTAEPHGVTVTEPGITEVERHPEMAKLDLIDNRSNAELRTELKALGQPTSGNRDALLARLAEATESPDGKSDGEDADDDAEAPVDAGADE